MLADAVIDDVRKADEPVFEVVVAASRIFVVGFSLTAIVSQGPLPASGHIHSHGLARCIRFQLDADEMNSYNLGRWGRRSSLQRGGKLHSLPVPDRIPCVFRRMSS